MNRSGLTRGFDRGGFVDLPSSADEVRIAQAAFAKKGKQALVGNISNGSRLKAAGLTEYRVFISLFTGLQIPHFPDRAALVLLSDRLAGEDGFLQASEIVQLRFDADLVVLSACDTAVGPLQDRRGLRTCPEHSFWLVLEQWVSTLWQVEDSSSLFLMKRFYAHLSANMSAASALTAAKRDMLRMFGRKALHTSGPASQSKARRRGPISSNESDY